MCGHPGTCAGGSGCLLAEWPSLGLGPQPAQGSPLGFPKSLKTKEKLCEYLTVVIFTASAQHAAVNFGQVGKDRASLLGGRWPGQLGCLRALGGLHHLLHRSGGGGAEGPGVWCSQGPVEFVLEFVPSTGCQCEGGGFPGPTGVGGGGSGRRPGRQSWVRAALAGGHPAGSVTVPQYDWCSWIPNAPPTMRAPPPTAKGVVTIEQIVDTLPDRGRSCWHLGAVWALSQFQDNEVRPAPTPSSAPRLYGPGLRLDPCWPGALTCKAGGTCEVLRPEPGWSSEWGGAGEQGSLLHRAAPHKGTPHPPPLLAKLFHVGFSLAPHR